MEGLPATFSTQGTSTLEIILTDRDLKLDIILSYSVFEKLDVVARSVFVNNGSEDRYLTKVMSVCLDMECRDWEAFAVKALIKIIRLWLLQKKLYT